ncbi:MAG: sterol desaturase family protein, partial [Myxococcales bacterium]|nr:sterol desaturase family protein [Myxococcales bacterium]
MNAGGSTVAGQRPRLAVHDPRAPGLSLRDAFLIFTRQRSARIIAALLVVTLTLRLAAGRWSGWDAAVLVALLALHPFTEWVIHVGILHWKPRRLGRLTIDTDLAREHRLHHLAPHDPRHWYTPMRGALVGFAISSAVVGLIAPTLALWLSFLVGVVAIGLVYEWTHYLCHTSYRPRGKHYRRLWRHHRLHHFKNEHYWMGVTMHLGDRLLGTQPSPKD